MTAVNSAQPSGNADALTSAASDTPSLHNPERHHTESLKQYRERQRASKAAARAVTTNEVTLHNRRTPGARAQFRDSMRKSGTMGKRIRASDALMAAWASKRVTKAPLRDDHGALTLIGSPVYLTGVKPTSREFVTEGGIDNGERFYTVRRVWLGGISAQRGY